MLKAPTAGAFLNLWSTKGHGKLLPPHPLPDSMLSHYVSSSPEICQLSLTVCQYLFILLRKETTSESKVSCSRWTHNQSQSLHLHLSIEKCLHSRQVAHPAGAHQCLTSPRMDEITAPPTSMRVKHVAQECKTMTQSSCKPRVQGQVVQSWVRVTKGLC